MTIYLVHPSLSQELSSVLQVIRRRLKQSALKVPCDGILAGKFEMVSNADQREVKKEGYLEIVVAGSWVHEFDLMARWAKPFKTVRAPSWLSA